MESLKSALVGVAAGDLECLAPVLAASHCELSDAAAILPRSLVVARSSLTKVLEDWDSGSFSAHDVQRWASFVRRGYVTGAAHGPTVPIRIEYAGEDEDQIADIISRLDEIGDQIDGNIDAHELDEILLALRK